MATGSLAALAGLFGAIAASYGFLLACRVPAGRDLASSSTCDGCGRRLRAIDLVPVFSWVLLQGRCRGCGGRIPARYAALEVLSGAAWAGLAALIPAGPWLAGALLLAWVALVLVGVLLEHGSRPRLPATLWVLVIALLPGLGVIALTQSVLLEIDLELVAAAGWGAGGAALLVGGAALSVRAQPRAKQPSPQPQVAATAVSQQPRR